MLKAQRFALIEQLLKEQGGSLSTAEVIERLGVSRETARRDIQEMQQLGLLTKVRGGVVLNQVGNEPSYTTRTVAHMQQKRDIAELAVQFVEDGDTVFVDSGTTLMQFALALTKKQRLTVLTNSLPIATLLCEHHVQVYVTGGRLREGDFALTGSIAESVADSLYVDKAFIGAGGVTVEHGVTDFHMEEVSLRKTVMAKAAHQYLLADSSKYGANAFVKLTDLAVFDAWVTDDGLPSDEEIRLKEAGIQVFVSPRTTQRH
ncbi:DeoR/GlpR family DNA-binding transcription regulator [Alicyclobacillus fastidiosus]|uniref:DeoR/GlpR family DNA-binding transcription regulator n=1 Tax=Alicyclobacillus fastidiosus TaxID=392011 RepID=A0ABY6ZAX6_9BACL|nr:DeoR/GlpR family DNA-binding transcription regulator [Alicyclobacillus fastidiosus]WAH39984.1 DeoR/GlpR family DNA-binding transcription regulator [Alicyclobacillus fastidiosus]GMA61275.1 DeoR family transcriptional regulator [Alicyclobacillus fastidiosus]